MGDFSTHQCEEPHPLRLSDVGLQCLPGEGVHRLQRGRPSVLQLRSELDLDAQSCPRLLPSVPLIVDHHVHAPVRPASGSRAGGDQGRRADHRTGAGGGRARRRARRSRHPAPVLPTSFGPQPGVGVERQRRLPPGRPPPGGARRCGGLRPRPCAGAVRVPAADPRDVDGEPVLPVGLQHGPVLRPLPVQRKDHLPAPVRPPPLSIGRGRPSLRLGRGTGDGPAATAQPGQREQGLPGVVGPHPLVRIHGATVSATAGATARRGLGRFPVPAWAAPGPARPEPDRPWLVPLPRPRRTPNAL